MIPGIRNRIFRALIREKCAQNYDNNLQQLNFIVFNQDS